MRLVRDTPLIHGLKKLTLLGLMENWLFDLRFEIARRLANKVGDLEPGTEPVFQNLVSH